MNDTIKELVEVIKQRKISKSDKSYTCMLLNKGLDACTKKLEEEFFEFKEAVKDKKNINHEGADLIYHLLVTLESANVKFEDILNELEARKNQSGLEEKKNRK
tara:strand:+ start:77 stop:385 length:309 start_codon:yes stop_codon:yes gene_type:complete